MRDIILQYDRIIEIINSNCNFKEHEDSLDNLIENFYELNKNEKSYENKAIIRSLYLVAKEKLKIYYEGLGQTEDKVL